MRQKIAYIGTYTRMMGHVHGKAQGIWTILFDCETGKLEAASESETVPNSSFLCLNSSQKKLYSINEICDFQGAEDGSLTVLEIEGNNLIKTQSVSAGGMGPAYLRIDHSGKWLFCANYVGGNIVVVNIKADGSLGEIAENIQLHGSGPNQERQEGSHPHAILPSPDNRFVYAIDLGTDVINAYRLDEENGKLTADESLNLYVGAGTGPRHFTFHPNGRFAYFVKELTSELSVCSFDAETGQLRLENTISTLPDDFVGESHCSELCLTQCGHHLYVANRGHDSIAMFEISGGLAVESLGHASCLGRIPRHICLSPDDQYLLVANQESNQVNCLIRNIERGTLSATSHHLDIPTPAYIDFVG